MQTKFIAFLAGPAALAILAVYGVQTTSHPFAPDQYLVEEGKLSRQDWKSFLSREDVLYCLTWVFALSGTTLVLPSDFNTASNTVYGLGAGAGGQSGTNGSNAVLVGCSPCSPCSWANGSAGNSGFGGGGGAIVFATNYSLIGAGGTVNIIVGAGDTKFDTTNAWLVAKAAALTVGGQSVACTTPSGGTAFSGGTASTTTGGGAAGPHGVGSSTGTGDLGNTAAAADGVQFQTTPARGSGGGGVAPGANAGKYGAGGAGGAAGAGGVGVGGIGGAGGAGGSASQGLIALSYTPGGSDTLMGQIWL